MDEVDDSQVRSDFRREGNSRHRINRSLFRLFANPAVAVLVHLRDHFAAGRPGRMAHPPRLAQAGAALRDDLRNGERGGAVLCRPALPLPARPNLIMFAAAALVNLPRLRTEQLKAWLPGALLAVAVALPSNLLFRTRSEERRVGKECRS